MVHVYRSGLLLLLALVAAAPAFAQRATLTGRVTDRADGATLPGASVLVTGTTAGTTADSDGRYRLSLPAGTHVLRVSYVGYSPATRTVTVGAGETATLDVALEGDAVGNDEVVVLGTRGEGRSVIDSPVPVDVLTAAEIQASGVTQTVQLLQSLVPSYNAPRPSIADGSDTFRPATLRGLGPDQVLVLVNGKRRHTSALVHVNGTIGRGSTGVDLNAIPPSAIGRIEVLRDGAAAQYGSDAIAGVINIILKDDPGFDAELTAGQYFSNEQRGYGADEGLLAGENVAPYAAWAAAEDRSRTDGQSVRAHAGYGFRLGDGGSAYVSAQYRSQGSTDRSGLDPRPQYLAVSGQPDPREATIDRVTSQYGEGRLEDASLFANATLPLGRGAAYASGGGSRRTAESPCNFRRSLDNRTVRAIYPDGFLPSFDNAVYDGSGTLGYKSRFAGWNADVSQTAGFNRFNFGLQNTANVSLGAQSPTTFDAGALQFLQSTTNVDFVRGFNVGLASALSVAVGGEFRYENYGIDRGEEASYRDGGVRILDGPNAGGAATPGSQCFAGFAPRNEQDESRSNVGVYTDLEINVVPAWLVNGAVRFENYSDFGANLSGKLATRLELASFLALRGAASTGFRAPSLAQSFYTSIATNFIGGVPFEVGTFPVNSPAARALGARDLKAEKSVNLSAGVTLNGRNASLTADAYQVEIRDRVVFTENFTGTPIQNFLAQQGINATGGRYFTNAVDTRTQGLDVTGRVAFEAGPGTLRLTAAGNLNKTKITNEDEIATPAVIQSLTTTRLFGRVEQGRFERGQPRTSVNAMAQYTMRRFTGMVRGVRYGEVRLLDAVPERDQTFGAKVLFDAELGATLPHGVRLSLGANNLFDVYPDKTFRAISFSGLNPYSGLSPFGFSGRYVYTRLSVDL